MVAGALHSFLVGNGAISAVGDLWTSRFAILLPCEMRRYRDFLCFLGYALYAATAVYQAVPTLNARSQCKRSLEVWSAKHIGEIGETSSTNHALAEGSGEGWLGDREGKLGAHYVVFKGVWMGGKKKRIIEISLQWIS